jgi:hypothetical protein
MNKINQLVVEYLKSNQTIETLKIDEKLVYVYNYEGNQFRLFFEVLELIQFFQFGLEPEKSFETDEALDMFLFQLSYKK